MNEFPVTEKEGSTRGRMGRRRVGYDDSNVVYKSKNLHAERRRREKLSQRLLQLRSLVPIITDVIITIHLCFSFSHGHCQFLLVYHLVILTLIFFFFFIKMNKGTIIEDAITYVLELQGKVQELTGMLNDMEASTISEEEGNTARTEEVIDPHDPEEMNQFGIKVCVLEITPTQHLLVYFVLVS